MRNSARILAVTLPLVGGCAVRSAEAPIAQAWLFEAQPAVGEVRVLPTLVLHEAPELTLQSFVDRNVGSEQRQIREARTRQLGEIPLALGQALPGAVLNLPPRGTQTLNLAVPADTYGTIIVDSGGQLGLVIRNDVERKGEYVLAFPGR